MLILKHLSPEFIKNKFQKAEKSLKFYKGIKSDSAADYPIFKAEFERLKSLANEQKVDQKIHLKDLRE